jgi:hypothetical protein
VEPNAPLPVALAFDVGGRASTRVQLSGEVGAEEVVLVWQRRPLRPATVRGQVGRRPVEIVLRPSRLTRGGEARGTWGDSPVEIIYTVDHNAYSIVGTCAGSGIDLAATKLRHGPIVVHTSAVADTEIRLELTNEEARPGITGTATRVADALAVSVLAGELLHEVRKNAYVNFDETKLGRDFRAFGPGEGTFWNPTAP